MVNYKKDAEIEDEMDTVDMGNFVKYDQQGNHTFIKCPYCLGPKLGHIQAKCPKVKYDKEVSDQFEIYLENLGGFNENLRKGLKRYYENTRPSGGERDQRVTEVRKQRSAPAWKGGEFEQWKKEIIDWYRNNNQREEEKYYDVLENSKRMGA